ncbi:MAG: phage tail tape measure protein [Dehalococcoidia bacterium]
MADTRAATGATTEQMEAMREAALSIGADTTKSATEAAAAMGELVKAGVSVSDTVGGVARSTVQLAEATGASVGNMATLMADAMNTFGLTAADATRMADTFVKNANASSISVEQLQQAMSQVGPVARQAGLSLEETAAAIGLLGLNGLKGSDSGSSLKTMLLSLAAPSATARAELERLNISLFTASGAALPFENVLGQLERALGNATEAQKAQSLATIFGSDAVRAGSIFLRNGVDGWQAYNQSVAETAGASETSAARMETLNGKIEELRGNLETLGIAIGTQAIPALTELTEKTTAVIGALDNPVFKTIGQGLLKQVTLPFRVAGTAIDATKKALDGIPPSVENMTEAQSQSTKQFEAHGAAMVEVNRIAAENARANAAAGLAAQEAGTAAATAGEQMGGSVTNVGLLAQALGKTAEQAEKIADPLGEAVKRIDELSGRATAAEMTWNRQVTALDSVASSAKAMTSALNPEDLQRWADRAHDMVNQSEAAAPAIEKMHREIDIIAKGGPGAADALDRINKVVDEAKAPYENATAATRDYAEAQGAAAKETLGIQGSIDDLKGVLTGFVEAFKVAIGQVPDSAKEAMRLTKEAVIVDLDAPGAESALSWAGGFEGKKTIIIQKAADAAGAAKEELSFDASSFGANAAASFAAGLEAGISRVRVAAAMLASAAKDSTQQSIHAGSPSKDFIRYGGWGSEGFAIGLERGIPAVVSASRRLGQAPLDALTRTLQLGSPSKLTIRYGEMTTEGYVIGLLGGTGEVVGAIRMITEAGLAELEAGVARFNALLDSGAIDPGLYAAGLADMRSEYERLSTPIATATDTLSAFDQVARIPFVSMRQSAIDTANLDAEIARLNQDLLYLDPYSERAAAINADIQVLEAWKAKVESNITVLQAEQAALEANKTAWDGVLEAREKILTTKAAADRLGPGGADVSALLDAAMGPEATAQMGRDAVAGLDAFVDDLLAKGGPALQATADNLRFLFWASFNLDTPEARANAKGQFDNVLAGLNTDAIASATLTADTYANAYAQATEAANLAERVGPTFGKLFDLLEHQAADGSAATIAKIAEMSVDIEREIGKLPEQLRGPLLADWKAAWDQFLATGDINQLVDVATRANRALELIPEGFLKMSPALQAEILSIIASMDDLGLSAEETAARITDATQAAADGAALAAQRMKEVAAAAAATAAEVSMTTAQRALGPGKIADTGLPPSGFSFTGPSASKANLWALVGIYGPATPQLAAALAEGLEQIGKYYVDQALALVGQPMGGEGFGGNAMTAALAFQGINPFASGEGFTGHTPPMGGSAGAQFAGEAQLSQLYARAQSMGLGAEATAIMQRYGAGSISLGQAIQQMQALISSGGRLKSFAAGVGSAAETLRAGGGFSPNLPGGGAGGGAGGSSGSGVAPIVSGLHRIEQELSALRRVEQELISLRRDLHDDGITAHVSQREVGQASHDFMTEYLRSRF